MDKKVIGMCSDHAGFAMKCLLQGYLEAMGYEYKDFGTFSADSCDYADFAHPCAEAVEKGECYPGIALWPPFFAEGLRRLPQRVSDNTPAL